MSSPSDQELAEIVESSEEFVTFAQIDDVISCDSDVIVKYTVGCDITTRPRDWVGLFRCSWEKIDEFVRYVPSQRVRRRNRRRDQLNRTVVFGKIQLQGLHFDGSYFEFVYVSADNNVMGVSKRFMLVADKRVVNLLTESAESQVHEELAEEVDEVEEFEVDDEEYLDGLANLFEIVECKKTKRKSAKQRRQKRKEKTVSLTPDKQSTPEVALIPDIPPADEPVTDNDVSQSVFDQTEAEGGCLRQLTMKQSDLTILTSALGPNSRVSPMVLSSVVSTRTDSTPTTKTITKSSALLPYFGPIIFRTILEKSKLAGVKSPNSDNNQAIGVEMEMEIEVKPDSQSDKPTETKTGEKGKGRKRGRCRSNKKEKSITENKIVSECVERKEYVKPADPIATEDLEKKRIDSFVVDNKIQESASSSGGGFGGSDGVKRERIASCSSSAPLFEEMKSKNRDCVINEVSSFQTPFPPQTSESDCHTHVNMMAMSLEIQEMISAKEIAHALLAEKQQLQADLDNERNLTAEAVAANYRYVQPINELKATPGKCSSCDKILDDVMYTLSSQGFEALIDKKGNRKDLSCVKGSLVDLSGWQSITSKKSEKNMAAIRRQEKTIDTLRAEVTSLANQCELLNATNKKLNHDLEMRDQEENLRLKKIVQLENQLESKDKGAGVIAKDLVASRTSVKSLTEIFATTEKDLKEQIRRLQVKLATRTLSAKKRVVSVDEALDSSDTLVHDRTTDRKAVMTKKRKIKHAVPDNNPPSPNHNSAIAKVPSLNHVKDDPAVSDLSDFSLDSNVQATKFQAIKESDSMTKKRTFLVPTKSYSFKCDNKNKHDGESNYETPHITYPKNTQTKTSISKPLNTPFGAIRPLVPKPVNPFMKIFEDSVISDNLVLKPKGFAFKIQRGSSVDKPRKNFDTHEVSFSKRRELSQTESTSTDTKYYVEEPQSNTINHDPDSQSDRNVAVVLPQSFKALAVADNRVVRPAKGMASVWDKMTNIASETCRFCGIILSANSDMHVIDEHRAFHSTYKK